MFTCRRISTENDSRRCAKSATPLEIHDMVFIDGRLRLLCRLIVHNFKRTLLPYFMNVNIAELSGSRRLFLWHLVSQVGTQFDSRIPIKSIRHVLIISLRGMRCGLSNQISSKY